MGRVLGIVYRAISSHLIQKAGFTRIRFQRTNGPEQQELKELLHAISCRVARFLERQGILERDEDGCMDAGGSAKQEPEPKTVA
jgi:hypothetical protein